MQPVLVSCLLGAGVSSCLAPFLLSPKAVGECCHEPGGHSTPAYAVSNEYAKEGHQASG